jgi:hypothetical protein
MRANIYTDRLGWLSRLNYKKLILIVFLARVILAAAFDISFSLTNKDIIIPDSRFYSIGGKYVSLILSGYDNNSLTRDMVPADKFGQEVFFCIASDKGLAKPLVFNEIFYYFYIVGFIYFLLGDFSIWVRVFNIVLSIGSAYLFFKIARRRFGILAANIFLIIALFLPAQFAYSISMSKDIMRMFIVALILWGIYG